MSARAPAPTSPDVTRAGALAMLLAVLATGCGAPADAPVDAGVDAHRVYIAEPFEPTPATIAYCGDHGPSGGDDAAIEPRITELLSRLTLAEKLQLMHGAALGPVEGTWLVRGHEHLGIPGLHMLDGPRGVSRSSGLAATAFPVAMMRGATWDPALEERVGRAIAREIRGAGADTLLAPTLNLLRHPRWGRAQETYSEDTHHMGELAVAFVRGVQSEGVLASAKHFAVNSIEDTRHSVDVVVDERTLREIYLPHFRRVVVEANVASVMSAYNRVNGLYCDLHTHLLTDILKGEWQFAGFVESDWVLGTHGDAESVHAGLDLEMPVRSEFRRLPGAIAAGEITEAQIDRSVRRLLRAQLCYGLDARELAVDDAARETDEHRALAREVARRGIVLLRNEPVSGAPALPLGAGIASIVVLGRNADAENIGDGGSSAVRPSDVVTALEGIAARAGTAIAVTHVATLDDTTLPVVAAAGAAIVVTGLDESDEGESDIAAGDRETLDLRADEVALIRAVRAANERTIVVLEGGAAITSAAWDDEIPALLLAFYPGSEGGHAIAEIVFGDASPSGRLPFSVPVQESDLPPFDNVSETVTYGYFHGYRHLEREGIAPHHPFGYGLSYTTFAYSELVLSDDVVAADGTLTATVTVTNTGSRRAIETVQGYVSVSGSRVERTEQDLRAFAQVELEPGASAPVTLRIRAADLAYWDDAGGRFEVERTGYELRVGSHAADPRLTAAFAIE